MTVVRVRETGHKLYGSGQTWWHIRPGHWYPASQLARRDELAVLPDMECDSWRHVLNSAPGPFVDDTQPGELPLNETERQ